MMRRNALRLLQLINQLLDLSKLEVGSMKLHAAPADIVPFIRGITHEFQAAADRKQIRLDLEALEDSLMVYFDKDKLEKVVLNLLSNALKFTPDGKEVTVRVGRSVSPSTPAQVELAISDSGIGIPYDELPRVFERFYQVDGSITRKQEGSGIGLSLAKELVDLHHGTLTIESTVGVGTVCTVRLPLGREHLGKEDIDETAHPEQELHASETVGTESQREAEPVPASTQGRPIVLVVEDNEDMRVYMSERLNPDFQVIEAGDGAEGFAKALEVIPDLVVSDVMMPKMDGFELCKRLKQDERTSHVPVILLTAKSDSESKIAGLDLGADDYVVKPFDANELHARIVNLIELRRKLRERFSLGHVLKPGEIAVTSIDDLFLQNVIRVVEARMSDEMFSVEDLAHEVNMSRSQLHRKLAALLNLSPSDMIRYMRLHRAMELLQKHAGTVSEIAYSVGFKGVSYFTKCFRDQFKMLPSDVRKSTDLPPMRPE